MIGNDDVIMSFPPGHYYSPIPSQTEIRKRRTKIFAKPPPQEILGIDFNEKGQLVFFNKFLPFYGNLPFSTEKKDGWRYYYENDFFSYADAITLYSMLRLLKPAKIVEIGSGHTSALMLDVNEYFLKNKMYVRFIEPFPDRLKSLLKTEDYQHAEIFEMPLQDISLCEFEELEAGDVLFIDSTHVAKIGSDVNYIFFEILPRLRAGVFIHFHDIFYPFEYPEDWVLEGRAWNELYMMRTFLEYNAVFKIVFFNHYFSLFHGEKWASLMPLCLKNPGGSLWLRKERKRLFF